MALCGDPVARQNISQIAMVVIFGADRDRQGRVRRPSLGSSGGGDTPRIAAAQPHCLPRSGIQWPSQRRPVGALIKSPCDLSYRRRRRMACRVAAISENPPSPPLPKWGKTAVLPTQLASNACRTAAHRPSPPHPWGPNTPPPRRPIGAKCLPDLGPTRPTILGSTEKYL